MLFDPENGSSSGPAVVYALRSWLMAILSSYISMHYINGCESIHGNARTFSEPVIASIIEGSRCGMSDVAFRIAHQLLGFLVRIGAGFLANFRALLYSF